VIGAPPNPEWRCANCDAQVPSRLALFCSERCRQIGELIRYGRRKLAEGSFDRPDIALAYKSRRSVLIKGFYDKRGRRVSDEERRELLARSKGRCEKCRKKFKPDGDSRFTVQHSRAEGGGFTLEAWCFGCNMIHARSVPIELADEDVAFLLNFDFRVRSPEAVRPCDDENVWPIAYREIVAARPKPVR
jgi:hypothetical protein